MRTRLFHLVLFASMTLFLAGLASACGGGSGDFCKDNCAAVVAAGCENGPMNMEDCLQGCSIAKSSCPVEFNGLAGCAGSNATFACNDYDSPAPPGCGAANDALQACLQDVDPYCYEACPAVVDAECTNGPVDVWDCLDGCDYASTNCPTEFDALAVCAGSNATFTCDLDDSPAPTGCTTENDDLNLCLSMID